jgi:ubiquinone/menaquinone biosynthesis C-methylase UbiE
MIRCEPVIKRLCSCAAALLLCIGLTAAPAAVQLAGRSADEWIKTLESPTRIASLKIDETIPRLKLKPTDIVVDIGAGSGVFEGPLSRAVPQGKVYAVDIDQGLLDNIEKRKKEFQITNVQTVLGKFTDPNLPTHDIDLAFINDVLHHIEDRAGYVRNLAAYLKPSGRIAVIEFVPDKGGHRDQPELQITQSQATAWMADAGMKPVDQIDGLFTDKWFVIYGKR